MKKTKIIISLTALASILIIAGINMKAKEENKSLKKKLTPLQYHVTQEQGTEPPFKNKYWNNKEAGIYVDIVSGEVLFSSLDKYDSGTGWPSFSRPVNDKHIVKKTDNKLFMTRIEVRSKKGDSHLGHVFNDGPGPGGLRYCINSASLRFIPVKDLEKEGYGKYKALFKKETAEKKSPDEATVELESATFAAGCFWGVEHIFKNIPGVVSTTAGYTGGHTDNPDYKEVSGGKTGHAEAVLVRYNPAQVSYKELLDYFWRMHDPTTLNRQGLDTGSQYRSAIFYHNEKQKKIALASKAEFDSKKIFKEKAVTRIVPAARFYAAEEYHQDFYTKNNRPVCHILRDK